MHSISCLGKSLGWSNTHLIWPRVPPGFSPSNYAGISFRKVLGTVSFVRERVMTKRGSTRAGVGRSSYTVKTVSFVCRFSALPPNAEGPSSELSALFFFF